MSTAAAAQSLAVFIIGLGSGIVASQRASRAVFKSSNANTKATQMENIATQMSLGRRANKMIPKLLAKTS